MKVDRKEGSTRKKPYDTRLKILGFVILRDVKSILAYREAISPACKVPLIICDAFRTHTRNLVAAISGQRRWLTKNKNGRQIR